MIETRDNKALMNLLTYIFSIQKKLLYEMSQEHAVDSWCDSHNWTEPRKLENGIWVAFPPNGVIETPIPVTDFCSPRTKILLFAMTFFNGLILIICIFAIGLLAVCIAPYFWLRKFLRKVDS